MITFYKLFGTANGKMKTFKTEEEMKEFMKSKGLSRFDVVQIQLASDDEAYSFDINILEETINGLEYVYEGDLYVYRNKVDSVNNFEFSWAKDEYGHLSKKFSSINESLKHFLNAFQENFYEGEEPENTRYSIYDVYSTRELL